MKVSLEGRTSIIELHPGLAHAISKNQGKRTVFFISTNPRAELACGELVEPVEASPVCKRSKQMPREELYHAE
jgi:hypothetical protein